MGFAHFLQFAYAELQHVTFAFGRCVRAGLAIFADILGEHRVEMRHLQKKNKRMEILLFKNMKSINQSINTRRK